MVLTFLQVRETLTESRATLFLYLKPLKLITVQSKDLNALVILLKSEKNRAIYGMNYEDSNQLKEKSFKS